MLGLLVSPPWTAAASDPVMGLGSGDRARHFLSQVFPDWSKGHGDDGLETRAALGAFKTPPGGVTAQTFEPLLS